MVKFDEPEAVNNKEEAENMNEDDRDEVSDLVDDLPEMFNTVDERLRKYFPAWTEGRAQLAREQAYAHLMLIKPLKMVLDDESTDVGTAKAATDPSLALFERCTRLHNPTHPDSFLAYIRLYAYESTVKEPTDVARNLRRIRSLYQKAVNSVGESKSSSPEVFSVGRFDVALTSLCQEWVEFEMFFGSERSLGRAEKAIQKKFDKTKRKREHDSHENDQRSLKRTIEEVGDVNDEKPKQKAQKVTEESELLNGDDRSTESQKKEKKIKYHPFTVRISNLTPETEDMDLVDCFRPKCGKIVHAKIIREKGQQGKGASKGWGLIQFEEREDAMKALALNGVVGINEKILTVEPSHMPAVTLVPPGMHRVSKTGEGRNSKKSRKKREHEQVPSSNETDKVLLPESEKPGVKVDEAERSKGADVLSFRPRKVTSKADRKRTRLQL